MAKKFLEYLEYDLGRECINPGITLIIFKNVLFYMIFKIFYMHWCFAFTYIIYVCVMV